MRIGKARTELTPLVRQLTAWETTVPKRARRFHALRQELQTDIEQSLTSRWPWLGDEVIERYRDRLGSIEAVAEPLVDLGQHVEGLESEVRALATDSSVRDTDFTAWLETRCHDWMATLSRVITTCERDVDLYRDQGIAAKTEADVRLLADVVHELGEAERVLEALGSNVRGAVLSSQLPELRKRLYSEGPTRAWLTDLRTLLEPVKLIADQPEEPPHEMRSIAAVLTDAREWANVVGQFEDDVDDLHERSFRSEPDDIEALSVEADALLARLIAQSNEMRSRKLGYLEAAMADLRQTCGAQPVLQRKIATLKAEPFDRPPLFAAWLQRWRGVQSTLNATAQSEIAVIESKLTELREGLNTKLEALKSRPLSHEVSSDVAVIDDELRRFALAFDVEAMLPQLRRLYEIPGELALLETAAIRDFRELDERQRELSERVDRFEAQLRRVRHRSADGAALRARLGELAKNSASVLLEERRAAIDAMMMAIETAESQFAADCRQRMAVQLSGVERAGAALQRADVAVPPFEVPPVAAAGPDLLIAAEALVEARGIHAALLRKARAVRADLRLRRERSESELQQLRLEELRPRDRQTVARLLEQLAPRAWSEKAALLDHVDRFAAVIKDADDFFARLGEEEQRARKEHKALQERLRAFDHEQLRRFCAPVADRVDALIDGVPGRPRDWTAVRRQLDTASELLDRIVTHAHRLAADELQRAAAVLRRRVTDGTGTSRLRAQALLAELDARGHETLPPLSLRSRVVTASEERG